MRFTADGALVDEISARFDLRDPNRQALEAVVCALAEEFSTDPLPELVVDLATGVGKTYLMSSLVDYAAAQGLRHVLVVTPGSVIQTKTVANFDAASSKYVAGADHPPVVITPDNFRSATIAAALRDTAQLKVFVFNVQQLIRPTDKVSRKIRETDENLGGDLYAYLEGADDLLVIADEHHIYSERAAAFSAAIRELHACALIGLTATPAPSDLSKVRFQYTLGAAIADGYVKTPVVVHRTDGTKDERTQLADACHLLRKKEDAYLSFLGTRADLPAVKPILFVVCTSIEHANDVSEVLALDGFIGSGGDVLTITSQSSDEALTALAACESPDSPIRAIVSVNMLREGWDVRNIAVIVALRRLASQGLTEQILGRGLRLPFGALTGVPTIDQIDLVAHDSYQQLLAQKDVLRERIETQPAHVAVDEHGAAAAEADLNQLSETVAPLVGQGDEDGQDRTSVQETHDAGPGRPQPLVIIGDGDDAEGALFVVQTGDRTAAPTPETMYRCAGAPQILFPRREARMTYAAFSLSDIPDGDARAAGARFIAEVPTFLSLDALVARRAADDIVITVQPQENVEAQQALTGIDTIREDLTAAIFRRAAETATEKRAARRITQAFLKGAGVVDSTETAEWGESRRQQAISGMTALIGTAYGRRAREMRYGLVQVTLPVEPVVVEAPLDAHNDQFVKRVHFKGWQRNIMPTAGFDAGTTEWQIAHLLDRDDEIAWWLRLYATGPAFIPTPQDGNYFPDFIAIDTAGSFWLIEGKADKTANDADVLRKKAAAENWARQVRDGEDDHGDWHYVFATEASIKGAGSWAALKVVTDPE